MTSDQSRLHGETMRSHEMMKRRGASCHGELTVNLHLFFLLVAKPQKNLSKEWWQTYWCQLCSAKKDPENNMDPKLWLRFFITSWRGGAAASHEEKTVKMCFSLLQWGQPDQYEVIKSQCGYQCGMAWWHSASQTLGAAESEEPRLLQFFMSHHYSHKQKSINCLTFWPGHS